MRKRILITGAAGFLGSHLCDRFINEGFAVIGMDNLITGNAENIQHLHSCDEFEFIQHDVTRFYTLSLHDALPIECNPASLVRL